MDEKHLLRLSLACSFIGVLVLYFAVEFEEAETIRIGDIGKEDVGKNVIVNGNVISKYYNGKHLFLELGDGNNKIDVVIFEKDLKENKISPTTISVGDHIQVNGKVNTYRGKLEVIGSNIIE